MTRPGRAASAYLAVLDTLWPALLAYGGARYPVLLEEVAQAFPELGL